MRTNKTWVPIVVVSLASAAATAFGAYGAGPHASSTQRQVLSRNSLRPEALGCLELLDSAGRSALDRITGAPQLARLDSTPDPYRGTDPTSTSQRRLEVIVGAQPRQDPVSIAFRPRWSADSLSDSVRLSFSNGFSGSVFILSVPKRPRSDTLSGRAYTHIDAGPPFESAVGAVRAVRSACPAQAQPRP